MRTRDEVACTELGLVLHFREQCDRNRAARAGCVQVECCVGRDPVVAAPAKHLNRGRGGVRTRRRQAPVQRRPGTAGQEVSQTQGAAEQEERAWPRGQATAARTCRPRSAARQR